jgi:hypothetical protein
MLSSCGGGGSGSKNTTSSTSPGITVTQINTTQQGAQTSITTINIANDIIGSFGLSNLVAAGSIRDMNNTLAFLREFTRKIRPYFLHARALKSTVTEDCEDGGKKYVDEDKVTFDHCRESDTESTGVITVTCPQDDCSSTMTVSFGTGNKSYEEIAYTDSTYSEISSTFAALCVLSQTISDYIDETNYKEAITGDGYIENENAEGPPFRKERIDLNNFSFTATYSDDEISASFDIAKCSLKESFYSSAAFDEAGLVYSKLTSFNTFTLLSRTDLLDLFQHITMNGTYGVNLTPNDADCFEGTFTVETTEEIIKDLVSEQIIDGEMKINETIIVHYDHDQDDLTILTITASGSQDVFFAPDIEEIENACPQFISTSVEP